MNTLALVLSSIAFSAWVAGFLNIRGTRLQQLRDRQVAAADDFAAAANEVFIPLTARMETLPSPTDNPQAWVTAFGEAVQEARRAVHDVTRRLARIELLFGVESATAREAVKVAENLLRMTQGLRDAGARPEDIIAAYERAADAFGLFNRQAHLVIAQPVWRQWIEQRRRTKQLPPARGS